MPIRYVEIPPDAVMINRATGQPYLDENKQPQKTSFPNDFIPRLFENPKWVENYANMKAARAIEDAIADAGTRKLEEGMKPHFALSEEDWLQLKDAAEKPRRLAVNRAGEAQVQPGLGYHPSFAAILFPFVAAIMEAKTTPPKTPA